MPRIITGTDVFDLPYNDTWFSRVYVMPPHDYPDAVGLLLVQGKLPSPTDTAIRFSWLTGGNSLDGVFSNLLGTYTSPDAYFGVFQIVRFSTGLSCRLEYGASGSILAMPGTDVLQNGRGMLLWIDGAWRDSTKEYINQNAREYAVTYASFGSNSPTGTYRFMQSERPSLPETFLLGCVFMSGSSFPANQEVIFDDPENITYLWTGTMTDTSSNYGYRWFTKKATPTGVNNVDLLLGYLRRPAYNPQQYVICRFVAFPEMSEFMVRTNF